MIPNTTTTHPDITIGDLRISTDLALHPEFARKPDKFAFSHNVNLADTMLPEASFKRDHQTGEKAASTKANIYLVHHNAISLFVKNDGSGLRLRSIRVNPAVLMLHGDRGSMPFHDLEVPLALLKSNVEPLLANPLDARHIVPGHADDNGEPLSYFSEVDCGTLLPDLEIACFHGLAHPLTGPAQGSTKKRIELVSSAGGCAIRFEKSHWESMRANRLCRVDGVAVTLTLRGHLLPTAFGSIGTVIKIDGTNRLVSFPMRPVAKVFFHTLSQMTGTYLPIPPEWAGMGRPVTHAKTIALLAQHTDIPIGELRTMYEAICNPSKSTRERLDDDVPTAAAFLKPVPVSQLFQQYL